MIKILFLNITLLISTVACVRSYQERAIARGPIEIIDRQNYIISMRDCPNFLKDITKAKQALVIACQDAAFDETNNVFDNDVVPDFITVFYVYGDKGYAALFVDVVDKSCAIEFCCQDNSYSYVDFLRSFMATFQILNHPGRCDATFTDLLEWEPTDDEALEDALNEFCPIEK